MMEDPCVRFLFLFFGDYQEEYTGQEEIYKVCMWGVSERSPFAVRFNQIERVQAQHIILPPALHSAVLGYVLLLY